MASTWFGSKPMGVEIRVQRFCATRPAPHSRNTESAASMAIMALPPPVSLARRDARAEAGPGVQRLPLTAGMMAKHQGRNHR